MFGLTGIKLIIGVIGISLIFSTWFYVKSLQSEIKAAHEIRTRLEDSIKAQDIAIAAMREDVARQAIIQRALNESLSATQQAATDVGRRFNQDSSGRERNFTAISTQQPTAIEQRVNRGTREALRCNEIVTGSPLTPDEQEGKTTNSICPHLLPPRVQVTR